LVIEGTLWSSKSYCRASVAPDELGSKLAEIDEIRDLGSFENGPIRDRLANGRCEFSVTADQSANYVSFDVLRHNRTARRKTEQLTLPKRTRFCAM
jgi:hypothetical protein